MDDELRELFKVECEEHLSTLEAGLLRLEASPGDPATLEAVFRAAHNLKGTGRMLGLLPLETIAHQCESLLGTVRNGQVAFSPEMLDRLSPALDAMAAIVHAAVTEEPHGVDIDAVLVRLSGASLPPRMETETRTPQATDNLILAVPTDSRTPEATGQITSVSKATPLPAEPMVAATLSPAVGASLTAGQEESRNRRPSNHPDTGTTNGDGSNGEPSLSLDTPSGATRAVTPTPAQETDTIRVALPKLDALIQIAGELSVTAERLRRGLSKLDDLAILWEEGQRTGSSVARSLTASIAASAGEARWRERMSVALEELRRLTNSESALITTIADEIEDGIRGLRLLPLSGVLNLFKRSVRDLSRAQGKTVRLVIEGGETTADKRILEEIKDPLTHMVRNAIDHGIEPPDEREAKGKPLESTLTIRAWQTSSNVIIEIEDDGRGLNLEAIRQTAQRRDLRSAEDLSAMSDEETQMLIFAPGFSTRAVVSDMSGRGVGMDVVRTNVERLKGTIQVRSRPDEGCRFRLLFPITLVTTRVLLCRVGQWTYAIPVETVEGIRLLLPASVFRLEGRTTISVDDHPVPVAPLADLLQIQSTVEVRRTPGAMPCILLTIGMDRFGVLVDDVVDEQEIMSKPLGGLLRDVPSVAGATILGTGEICIVLNVADLASSLRQHRSVPAPEIAPREPERKKKLLLVDDSITTRTWEKRFLEAAGYDVVTCADGEEGLVHLLRQPFDAVVSDIEMPRLDGFSLTERIRKDDHFKEMPILLVTTRSSDEDRKRGVALGADAYIVKGPLEKDTLLEALKRLI